MQCGEDAADSDLENRSVVVRTTPRARTVQIAIFALRHSGRWPCSIAVITEAIEGLEARAVGLHLEHRAETVCTTLVSSPIQKAILALYHGGFRIAPISAAAEAIEGLEFCAVGLHLEHRAETVCTTLVSSPI